MAGCCFLFCRSRADEYLDAPTLPSVKARHGQRQDMQVGSSRIIGVAAGCPKSNSMSGSASASKHGGASASLLDLANQMSPKLSAAWINDALWLAENPSTHMHCDVMPDTEPDYAIVAAHEEAERRRLSDIAFYVDHNSSHSTTLVGQLSTTSSFNYTQPCYSPSTLSSLQLHSLGGRPSPDLHTIHEQGKPDNHSGDSNKEDGGKPADTARAEHSSASPAMRRAAPWPPLAPSGFHQSLPRSQSTQPNKRLSTASAADLSSEDVAYGPSASAVGFNRRSTGTGYCIKYNPQDVHTPHSSSGSRLPGSWRSSTMSSTNTPSAADIARQYGCTSTTPSRQSRLNSGSGSGALQATSGPLPISADVGSNSCQQGEPLNLFGGSPPETGRGFLHRFTSSLSRGVSRASGNIKRASSGNCSAAASTTHDTLGQSPWVRPVGHSDGGIHQEYMPPRYFDVDLYTNIMHMLAEKGAIRNTSSAGGHHAQEAQQAEPDAPAEQKQHAGEEQPQRELNDA